MESPNIFKALSKYGSRQEEDYLTESFVLLMKLLIERDRKNGMTFINKICGLRLKEQQFKKTELLSISTQIVVDDGRPDIEIRYGSEILIYIEIKHDSSLGDGQLEYYRKKLDESDYKNSGLILLTRSLASSYETTLPRNKYHHICWYDIHRWLSNIKQNENNDIVCNYFIKEFLMFLEEKQMSLERIGWEYINGVPSLVALCNLLEVAIIETTPSAKPKKSGGFSWLGFMNGGFFCGIRYSEPLTIVFENNKGIKPSYKYDLDLEESHFFSLNQAEQIECLVAFIKEAYAGATEEHKDNP